MYKDVHTLIHIHADLDTNLVVYMCVIFIKDDNTACMYYKTKTIRNY